MKSCGTILFLITKTVKIISLFLIKMSLYGVVNINLLKKKKLTLNIDKYNWIQIIEGNLLLKSKDPSSNIRLSSGDGLGFEVINYDDISIETEKELDYLLFSMPSL